MTDPLKRIGIVGRLRTVRGHLHAVERLIAEDRVLDAALQLRAVRGAVTRVLLEACRAQVERCRTEGVPPEAVEDLVAMARLVTAPAKCTRRVRWRSMSIALHAERHN